MKSKNKKGFTLVELLAVIVILAVVILIAVTAVIPRMNNAKEKAFVDEAMMYMKAAKEAYVTDPTTECHNISDMSSLVKQNKEGYSGTVYASDGNVSINITNGKYYIKTSRNPSADDIVTTKPSNFISSCNESNVTTYNIAYILNNGTVSENNPTTYNQKTPTITLNNPTRSGYRFVGWSSKNLFDVDAELTLATPTDLSTSTARSFKNNTLVNGIAFNNSYNLNNILSLDSSNGKIILNATSGFGIGFPINSGYQNKNYVVSFTIEGATNSSVQIGRALYDGSGSYLTHTYTGYNSGKNSKSLDATSAAKTFLLTIGSNAGKPITIKNIQLEEGTTATDYQEYMKPTKTAKIYQGSMGNKTFIANWGPLVYHVTLDNQGATSSGTPEVYYEVNTSRTINGVVCYYYYDSEVTNCLSSGYYISRPTKTGYTFDGYYTEPNGGGTQYVRSNGGFTNNIFQTTGDRTLYANWIAN